MYSMSCLKKFIRGTRHEEYPTVRPSVCFTSENNGLICLTTGTSMFSEV